MHSILAVTDAPFTQAPALLFFHLLGLILYVGGFLALSRWLAKAVRFESADARTPCAVRHVSPVTPVSTPSRHRRSKPFARARSFLQTRTGSGWKV